MTLTLSVRKSSRSGVNLYAQDYKLTATCGLIVVLLLTFRRGRGPRSSKSASRQRNLGSLGSLKRNSNSLAYSRALRQDSMLMPVQYVYPLPLHPSQPFHSVLPHAEALFVIVEDLA